MRENEVSLLFLSIIIFLFLWLCLFLTELKINDKINLVGENIDEINTEIRKIYLGIVTVKAFTNHPDECDGDPDITATNQKVQKGIVAISPDFEQYLTFGDQIWLQELDQYFIVGDRTRKDRRRQIEIYFDKKDKEKAIKFGKRKTHIYLIKQGRQNVKNFLD